MKFITTAVMTVIFAVLFSTVSIMAESDTLRVTYQGLLTDGAGNAVADGSYELIFRVYDQSAGGAPLAVETVVVDAVNGLFTALLKSFSGDVLDGLLFPPGPDLQKLFLEIQVGSDPPISPRIELGTVPHSIVSQRISGDVITSPGQLIVSGPDPAQMITLTGDDVFGPSIELEVDDNRFLDLRCDKKKTAFQAIQTDDFGDTTGVAALSVDSAFGPSIELRVGDEQFMGLRCNKKVAIYEAIQTDDFGDTTGMAVLAVDSAFGPSMELEVDGSRFLDLRCDKKKTAFQTIQTDDFGDTTGMAVLAVDSAFGPSIELRVGDEQFMGLRCNKKVAIYEAIQTDDFGDTTGLIAQTVDNGGVSLIGKQGDDVYGTVLDGASITTRYTYDGLDRLATTADSDGARLIFLDAPGGDTTAVLDKSSIIFSVTNVLDVVKVSADGIVYVNAGDTTVSLTPDGILDIAYYLQSAGVRINEAAGTRRMLRYGTDGVRRFEAAVNQTPETGSDAGSDYVIARFDDAGDPLGAAFFIERSTGEVGIKTTNPGYDLDVQGTIGGTGGLYHSSDLRLKKNVHAIDNALEKVTRLRGVQFEWRRDQFAEKNLPDGEHIGLIAQEVETLMPEVVNADGEGYKSVAYGNLIALLIEGLKEQQRMIEGQNEKINGLQAQVTQLAALVRTLANADSQSEENAAPKK